MRVKQTFDLDQGASMGRQTASIKKASGRQTAGHRDAGAKTRMLEAALDLFGKQGFSDTGVRELAAAAEVNVAAVSYHFGSKDNLRIEALRYGFAPIVPITARLRDLLEIARQQATVEAAENALTGFVAIFLKEAIGKERKHWPMFMRERLAPGPALDVVMREFFAPIGQVLSGIVVILLPGASPLQVNLCVASIIGQCVHVRSAEPMLRFFTGRDPRSREYLDLAAAHISEFSIQALRGLRAQLPAMRER
jgi:AcrR family transcriptional regulator